jgi:hypothetical protein
MMNEHFGLAQLIDVVIAFTLIECALLAVYHRTTGHGVAPRAFLPNVASGLCLMFALRCLARDTGAAWVALGLLAAGIAHGVDLRMRWKHAQRNQAVTQRVAA